jgi:hypothetical protein
VFEAATSPRQSCWLKTKVEGRGSRRETLRGELETVVESVRRLQCLRRTRRREGGALGGHFGGCGVAAGGGREAVLRIASASADESTGSAPGGLSTEHQSKASALQPDLPMTIGHRQ